MRPQRVAAGRVSSDDCGLDPRARCVGRGGARRHGGGETCPSLSLFCGDVRFPATTPVHLSRWSPASVARTRDRVLSLARSARARAASHQRPRIGLSLALSRCGAPTTTTRLVIVGRRFETTRRRRCRRSSRRGRSSGCSSTRHARRTARSAPSSTRGTARRSTRKTSSARSSESWSRSACSRAAAAAHTRSVAKRLGVRTIASLASRRGANTTHRDSNARCVPSWRDVWWCFRTIASLASRDEAPATTLRHSNARRARPTPDGCDEGHDARGVEG